MKKLAIVFIFLIVLSTLLSLPTVKACFNITLNKAEFFPYQLIQLDLSGDFASPPKETDFFFYRENKRISVPVFLVKLGKQHYFAFFYLKHEGDYVVRIRANAPKFCIKEFPLSVKKPIFYLYKEFSLLDWERASRQELLFASLTLKNSNLELKNKLKGLFYRNLKGLSCKEALLCYFAFNDSFCKNLALECYNSFDSLLIEANCNATLSYDNKTEKIYINGSKKLNLSTYVLNISLDCNGKIKNKNFEKEGREFTLYQYCFSSQKNKLECDNWLTSFSLLVFNNSKTREWVEKNYYQLDEEEKLFYLYKYAKEDKLNEIENVYNRLNQKEKAILYGILKKINKSNYELLVQKNLEKDLLKFSGNKIEKSYILFFSFSLSQLEPLIETFPGIIKTKSGKKISLIFTNHGPEAILSISFFNFSFSFELKEKQNKKIVLEIPKIVAQEGILLDSVSITYSVKDSNSSLTEEIPLIVFTERAKEEKTEETGKVTFEEKTLNETQEEKEKVMEEIEKENRSVKEEVIKNKIYFKKEEIKKEIKEGEELILSLELINEYDKIKNIEITAEGNFGFIVEEITPSYLEKMEKGRKTIKVRINTNFPGNYTGGIMVKANYNNKEISNIVPVELLIEKQLKPCSEIGVICGEGEICEGTIVEANDTLYCCKGICKKKTGKRRIIGLVILLVVILLLVLLLIYLQKKPKRKITDVVKKLEEKHLALYRPYRI